jgi:large subunit ribosomal protein L29
MSSAAELRELDETELENKLVEARKELFNLRFQAATGRLDNNSRVTQVRREIARLMTVQRAHEIELAESAEAVVGRADAGTKEQ